MNAGKLDRRVAIQTRTETIGASGGVALAYATRKTLWCERVSTTGRESRSGGAVRAEADLTLRVRYDSTLTERDRLLYESKTYDVISIEEEGRRESQLIQARYTAGAST